VALAEGTCQVTTRDRTGEQCNGGCRDGKMGGAKRSSGTVGREETLKESSRASTSYSSPTTCASLRGSQSAEQL